MVVVTILCFSTYTKAQIGGKRSFEFLNLPVSARISALGGVNVSLADRDPGNFLANPALIDSIMDKVVSINHLFYFAGTNYSNVAYAHHFKKAGTFAAGLQYINYGEIDGFDETGAETTSFQPNEFALSVGYSYPLGNFSIGANTKFAFSSLASYTASTILFDLGASYKHPKHDFTVGLTVKNLGLIIKDYTSQSQTKAPLDIQLGMSVKPQHMPVRFSVTAHQLYRRDIAYFDSAYQSQAPKTFDKIFRHFVFGLAFIPSKVIHFRAGYNHLVRSELKLEDRSGLSGFSFGLMLRIKAFEFAYTKAFYHLSGSTNHFTLSLNLNSFIKKKPKQE